MALWPPRLPSSASLGVVILGHTLPFRSSSAFQGTIADRKTTHRYHLHHLRVSDADVEDRSSPYVACLHRTGLGHLCNLPSCYSELGGDDGPALLPRDLRGWLWAWHPLPAEFLLLETRGRCENCGLSKRGALLNDVLRSAGVWHYKWAFETGELEVAISGRRAADDLYGANCVFLSTRYA